jgi:cardiolipin synthase
MEITRAFVFLFLLLLATATAVGSAQNPVITEVYYDTYLNGDTDGEFIRIHNPTGNPINIGGWQITDREGAIIFPGWADIPAGGSLYLAYNATAFYDEMLLKSDFEYGVDSDPTPNMIKEGGLKLNNVGDEVILMNSEDEIVDAVIYGTSDYAGAGWTASPVEDAAAGVILERDRNETTGQYEDTNSSADWDDDRIYIIGQSHFPYASFNFVGNVTVFTSPDSSFRQIATAIENAEESIYVNVYQFHQFYVMDHIIDAIERGVAVKIMLEGNPVNGIADEERYIANRTVTAGGEVRFMINDNGRGIHDRYAFNHAKYAIIDNETTVVMSENWKKTGVPVNNTFGNRGWGVIIDNPEVTGYFCAVFFEDWKPASKDSFPFTPDDAIYGNNYGRPPHEFVPDRTIPTGNYSHPFESRIISGEFFLSPVLAPDTALMQTKSILGMIKGAEESVYVDMLYIYKDWSVEPNPFLEAVINAARRGCEVKILLNPSYSFDRNKATIDYVMDIAAHEGLPMDAKFTALNNTGLNKTHNKGVIVDRSSVLISSVNWNEHSPRNNREVGVIIQNEAAAEYYTAVFFYDWYNGSLPPVADFTYSPAHPVVHQTVIFNASSSYDSDGDITNYEWEFGDGNSTNTTGKIVMHAYATAGNYTVHLTVTDNEGAANTSAAGITVSSMPDMVITDAWVCWPDNCTICYNVTNIGNGTAQDGHNTTLFVEGVEVAYDHVDGALEPDASYTGCFDGYNWTYTPLKDNITVCADSNNTVDESNETNNCLTTIWVCGDVNCDGAVDMSDVIDMLYYVGYPGHYTICNEWSADVNCDGAIDMSDVRALLYYVGYPGQYELNCCK